MVPKDWSPVYLNDIADKIMVGIASAATHAYTDNGIRMLRNLNIKEGFIDDSDILFVNEEYELQHKNKRLKAGDILTVRTGYPGLSAVVPKKYDNAQCFTSLITRLKEEVALPDYICRFINSEYGKKYISSGEAGGAQKNVNASILKKMLIPLPSLPEQRKIAKILSTWDKAISTTVRLIDNSKRQKKALMQQLLTGKKRLLDDSGKPFEGEWSKVELGKLLDYKQPTPYLVKSTDYSDEYSTPVLTAGKTFILGYSNEDFGIFEEELPAIIFDDFTTASKFVDFPFKAKSSAMKILVAKQGVFIKFVYEAMQVMNYPVGGHQRHWISIFANLVIGLPSLSEQQKIASVLSNADKEIQLLQQQLADLKQEKKALMQQLLTGKRRVKVDDKEVA